MPDHPKPAAPRDISADEHQDRAEEAFKLDQSIKGALRTGRATLWALAEKLWQFDDVTGWSALNYDSLADWLADPEISMKSSTYYNAVARWRKIVVLRNVDSKRLENLDPTKVDLVLPSIEKQSVKLEDALSDVEVLGARDLREKYIGRKEKAEPDPPDPPPLEPEDEPDPDGAFDDGSDGGTQFESEPAHNEDHAPSGQLQRVEEGEEFPVVVTATATPRLNLGGLKVAVQAAEVALRLPDRQAVDRRAKRDALANLVAVVKLIDGWWEV